MDQGHGGFGDPMGGASEHDQEESYFVSMTDLMVGMLFIFIIMLMAFVLDLRQAEVAKQEAVQSLNDADSTRSHMLDAIRTYLKDKGVQVDIDREHGIMHLPEEILFGSGKAELTPEGQVNIGILAGAMRAVLPCYAGQPAAPDQPPCPAAPDRLEAILIEGHTDSDPVDPRAWFRSNLGLSSFRAINTFERLMQAEPTLALLKNPSDAALFGVSGYGDQRLRVVERTDADKRLNRRIDLRFLMATPRPDQLDGIEAAVRNRSGANAAPPSH